MSKPCRRALTSVEVTDIELRPVVGRHKAEQKNLVRCAVRYRRSQTWHGNAVIRHGCRAGECANIGNSHDQIQIGTRAGMVPRKIRGFRRSPGIGGNIKSNRHALPSC